MTEYITGWGITSKQLKALLHMEALYITAIPNCAGNLYSEVVFEGKVEAFYTLPQAKRIAVTPLFTSTNHCVLDNDDDFWVLIPTDETPMVATTAGFLWRLRHDGDFCIATQEQVDSGRGMVRKAAREGVAAEPITLYYGAQIIPDEDDEEDEADV
ncbi:hypothetical protein RFF05_13095 [Bengtsoniella intestinalis]|uniref:hypothetical protein n=1 Tax=Bengtsoniella intestinalis TaxID=3073143 RepID=UPI00391FBB59